MSCVTLEIETFMSFLGAHGIENLDPTERKRQKARERYGNLPKEKEEKDRKSRKIYQHKKGEGPHPGTTFYLLILYL